MCSNHEVYSKSRQPSAPDGFEFIFSQGVAALFAWRRRELGSEKTHHSCIYACLVLRLAVEAPPLLLPACSDAGG